MSDTDATDVSKTGSQFADKQAPGSFETDDPVKLPEPGSEKPKSEQIVQPAMTPTGDTAPEGSAASETPQPAKSHDEWFAMPPSFEERFILTYEANRQELFRSYADKRPAISDRGDSLHTRNADRSTAMDMIELAAHRGWPSMKVKGPEDFRREMWIEGTAQGIEVKGYRPNSKDQAEAERRADLIEERVIERTDQSTNAHGHRSDNAAQYENLAKGASNVVPMIDYQKGLEGKVTGIGAAPYRDREGAAKTPFVALELADGRSHKLWGVALPDMIDKHQIKVGDKAKIYDDGKKAVTIKERNPKTGEEHDKQTFRREWGARDIIRAPEREGSGVEPVQKRDEVVIEPTSRMDHRKEQTTMSNSTSDKAQNGQKPEQGPSTDRLEERLNRKEATRDPILKGAASTLAKMEAEMRAAGVPEKDRITVRQNASHELARGIREGRQFDLQTLPNVSKAQERAARTVKSQENTQAKDKDREQPQHQDRGHNR